MTDKDLIALKTKYQKLVSKKNKLIKLKEEKERLKQDENVKRYLEVLDILSNTKDSYQYDNTLMDIAISSIRLTEPSNIYVYIGTYKESYEVDIVHGGSDYIVNYNDPQASYSLYKDIETTEYKHIRINQRKQFEESNTIIKPKTSLKERAYYELRYLYFKEAIENGKETAVEKVLTK